MRALATRLSVVPGALYRHVRNKEQLHDLLLDGVLAEAFLAPLHKAGLPPREAGLAYALIYGYTLGFALDGPDSVNEQRVRDAATRAELHEFIRTLPPDRFPTLVALGRHVWVDNRGERFATALDTILRGLDAPAPPPTARVLN